MISKTNGERASLTLSKDEKRVMRHIRFFQFLGISFSLVGVGGVLLGIYSFVFRPMTSGESQILFTLTLYSVVFVIFGWMYFKMAQLVEKLKKLLNL